MNDANDMEAALRDLGFTVDKLLNASRGLTVISGAPTGSIIMYTTSANIWRLLFGRGPQDGNVAIGFFDGQ